MAKTRKLSVIVGADISRAEKAFWKLGNQADRTGKQLSKSLTLPLVAVGGYAAKAAYDLDDAFDKIRAGTGATGKALEGLKDDFRVVARDVPHDFDTVATVIADVNTRLGYAGKGLQDFSKAVIDASRLTGSNFSSTLNASARAMQSWNVAVDDSVGFMDKLFITSQSTGITLDRLAERVARDGATFRQLGFEVEQAMALLGNFEKQGVEVEKTSMALRMAVSNLSRAGVKDLGAGFREAVEAIKNAGSAAEANAIAIKVFGSRAGPEMAAAIREGRFAIEGLVKDLDNASGAIQQTVKDTDGFAENIVRMKNKIDLVFEPLGNRLLAIAEEAMDPWLERMDEMAFSFTDAEIKAGLYAASLGPVALGLSSVVKTAATLLSVITGPAGLVIGFGALAGGAFKLQAYIDELGGKAQKSTEELKKMRKVMDETKNRVQANAETNPWGVFGMVGGQPAQWSIHQLDYEAVERKEDEALRKREKYQKERDEARRAEIEKRAKEIADAVAGSQLGDLFSEKSKGPSATEKFVSGIRDQIKYMGKDAKDFLPALAEWEAKLKPLSDDWKLVKDLQMETTNDMKVQEKALLQAMAERHKKGLQYAEESRSFYRGEQAWMTQQGLMGVEDYLAKLKGEFASFGGEDMLANLVPWTDEMKDVFGQIQSVTGDLTGKSVKELNKQLESGKITTAAWKEEITQLMEQYKDLPLVVANLQEIRDGQEKNKQSLIDLNELTVEWARDLQSGIADAILEGKNLTDVLSDIGREVANVLLKMALFGKSGTGGLFGSLFGGLFGFADGGVFVGGRVTPFAKGGVVTAPTLFPMANGAGLMGEAGAEAVMPLKRIGGRLGVEADLSGGAQDVTVNIINQSGTALDATRTDVRQDPVTRNFVIDVVVQSIRNNGPVRQAIRAAG